MTHLTGSWPALISKEDETEPKPILCQGMVVLVSSEGGTALVSKYSSSTLHCHVSTKHGPSGSTEVHLQRVVEKEPYSRSHDTIISVSLVGAVHEYHPNTMYL